MRLFTEFHINKDIKAALAESGLSDYTQFITFTGGDLVSRPQKNPVRRIQVNMDNIQKTYYLKQTPHITFSRALIGLIKHGQWPHAKAYKEMLAVQYYKKLGIPVMDAVSWGEKRIFGWPQSGFLLVEEIQGKNFALDYIDSTMKNRKQLAYGYGRLISYMHHKDVYDDVRCEEIICTSDDVTDFRNLLVIDREYGRTRKSRITSSDNEKLIRKANSLANAFLTLGRSHIFPIPTSREVLAFLAGYFSENKTSNKTRQKLLVSARETLNKRVDNQDSYKERYRERYEAIRSLVNSF